MNPFEMVVAIVAITAIASVLRGLFGLRGGRREERMMRRMQGIAEQPSPETERLREEVRGLKERVAVLERLITDQSSALDREFDKLRQMD